MERLPFFLQINLPFLLPSGPWITFTAMLPSLNLTENLEGEGTEKLELGPPFSGPDSFPEDSLPLPGASRRTVHPHPSDGCTESRGEGGEVWSTRRETSGPCPDSGCFTF